MLQIKTGRGFIIVCTAVMAITSLVACKGKKQADLVIHHAVIYTIDSAFSTASAIAISNGKILELGTNEAILGQYEAKETVNAAGKFIYPGFIDAHCHFTGYATDSWKCDLVGTASFAEIIERMKTYSKTAPMYWLYGRGWDQNDWENKGYPNKSQLDSLFPNRPVFLKRIDGHAALVNQKALELASINASTNVDGGSVEVIDGKLTGLLIDNAMDLVDNIIPHIPDSLARKYFTQMQQLCFAEGLTTVQDCGVSEHTVELVDEEQKAGRLKMKIFALLSDSTQYYDRWITKGPYQTERLHVGGFKFYADGALGSRGACMLQDYSDKPGWKGFMLSSLDHFERAAGKLAASKLQMCTHAIGDSGNRQLLQVYANVLKGKNDRRWRIEHAQVVHENDFHFFADYNIIPSVQPTHATSDMYWAGERIGSERIANAYAYQRLLQLNNWLPLGTDFPVEYISPMKTFYAAVVRKDAKGFPEGGFQKGNALSREQALRGMTIWAAKAAFEENEKGSLEPGKMADFVILNQDLMHCGENMLLSTEVLYTYINGEQVYKK